MEKSLPQDTEITQKEKEFAALSYLWIFAILIYYSPEAKSRFVKHHSKQAYFLFVLSIIFYFLPGYFSFLNILVLFLMVLGVIEATLGHWYYLPLVGEWLDGKFSWKQISLFSGLLEEGKKKKEEFKKSKVRGFFARGIKTVKKEYKDESKDLNLLLNKSKRGTWTVKIKDFEKYLKNLFKGKEVNLESFDTGLNIMNKGKKIMVFGGVEDNKFIIAYLRDSVFLMGDSSIGKWEIKKYSVDSVDKDAFEAFVKLMFEE